MCRVVRILIFHKYFYCHFVMSSSDTLSIHYVYNALLVILTSLATLLEALSTIFVLEQPFNYKARDVFPILLTN